MMNQICSLPDFEESPKGKPPSFLDWNFSKIHFEFNIFTPWTQEAEDTSNSDVLLSDRFIISNRPVSIRFTDGSKLIILEKNKPIGWVYGFLLKLEEVPKEHLIHLMRGPEVLTLEFSDSKVLREWVSVLGAATLKQDFEKKYTIKKIIGKGGFAKVYCVSAKNGEKFAAKVFQKTSPENSIKEQGELRNKVIPLQFLS